MKKRTYVCTIESAGDGYMIIWLGKRRIEASCLIRQEGTTRLSGTVRHGPASWINHNIEVSSADNENGTITLAA